jgi:hypothetical protein
MRVIVAPGDVAPIEIDHPALFLSKRGAGALAAARTAEADEAACRMEGVRRAVAATPMIAQCLIGGYGWLQVKCRRCEAGQYFA